MSFVLRPGRRDRQREIMSVTVVKCIAAVVVMQQMAVVFGESPGRILLVFSFSRIILGVGKNRSSRSTLDDSEFEEGEKKIRVAKHFELYRIDCISDQFSNTHFCIVKNTIFQNDNYSDQKIRYFFISK